MSHESIDINSTSPANNSDRQSLPPSRSEYVEVLVPLPLHAVFTYRLPSHMVGNVGVGHRVIVPFGTKKFYTAIVTGFANLPPANMEVKEVALLLDNAPVLRHPQLKLWSWIADYYLAAVGDVYKAALPAGLKIESETFVEVNPDYNIAENAPITERETEIYQLLSHEGAMTTGAIANKLKHRGAASTVNAMVDRGILIVAEKLNERYRPRYEQLVEARFDATGLSDAFAAVKGAPKQEKLLLAFLELSGLQQGKNIPVKREQLLERAEVLPSILTAVTGKGLLKLTKREVNRFKFSGTPSGQLPRLSEAQLDALEAIHLSWKEKDITLLHGVTSSGKTEIYIHLINFVLNRGDQVLMLVPEIALTTQLTRRLQKVFGNAVVIYHSKFTDSERVDIWKRLLHSNEPLVIIGARSAVFLPFAHLGLVIVDEEHESSYKQFDPAPRYNGRDVAMVLAKMHGAKTLLGSATPSVETYYKATTGKFGLVSLTTRYGNVALPRIEVMDMNRMRREKSINGTFATATLRLAHEVLDRGSQIILFQNRRGYAPLARCRQCAWVPRCEHCDVALTYHSHLRQLQCHYCGAVYPLPKVCPQCHEPAIEIIGYGTERVEEEVEANFKGKRILRMDLDSTRSKDAYANIIDDFSEGKARILVGTQMVTKGLDFAGVEMVGILNADSLINMPDFRASERAFNMLEQVSGRSGRRENRQGVVVIQSYQPTHPIISFVRQHDFQGFFNHEIEQRKAFAYPPFSRIIYIYLKHRDIAALKSITGIYADYLRKLFGTRVFGPEEPLVGRIQGLFIRKIMLKVEVNASMSKVKELLRQAIVDLSGIKEMRSAQIYYDVDPF